MVTDCAPMAVQEHFHAALTHLSPRAQAHLQLLLKRRELGFRKGSQGQSHQDGARSATPASFKASAKTQIDFPQLSFSQPLLLQ